MAAQKVVTGAHRQAHQPMFERRFAAKTTQLQVSLAPNLLDNVFDFRLATGITARGGKDARRITGDQRFETGRIALEHRGYEVRIGLLHQADLVMRPWKNKATAFVFYS